MHLNPISINSRQLTRYLPLPEEFIFQPEKNYLFDLSYVSCLTIRGEQAARFLQGQLSCDINQINSSQMRPGALLNLKGRIVSLLDVVHWHELQLFMPDDLIQITSTALAKVAMLTQTELVLRPHLQFYGLLLQNKADLLPFTCPSQEPYAFQSDETTCCYAISKNLYIIATTNDPTRTTAPFIQANQWRGSLAWHQLCLRNKQCTIYPETKGCFLPHRLNLHQTETISFDKGCYKGQEIVARTHYRAKLKHELLLFSAQSNAPFFSGQKLFNPTTQEEIGELIDFSPLGNNHYLLAASYLLSAPLLALFENHENPLSLTPP